MISLFLLRMMHPGGNLLNPFVPKAMCIFSALHRSHAFAPALYGDVGDPTGCAYFQN